MPFLDGGIALTDVCLKAQEDSRALGVSTHHLAASQPDLTCGIGIPFIGRLHDIPTTKTWLHFFKWGQEFGPIYKHELFGTTHVWISSEAVAKDLLAKQAAIMSDRPLITNLPINKTGGEYLPLLGENGTFVV